MGDLVRLCFVELPISYSTHMHSYVQTLGRDIAYFGIEQCIFGFFSCHMYYIKHLGSHVHDGRPGQSMKRHMYFH